jgi:serine protease inhibitor
VVGGGDLAVSPMSRAAGVESEIPQAVEVVQAFTADLYRRQAATSGNLVCSPYSVAVALAMTRNGARGRTAAEMDAVLHATTPSTFDSGMNALVQRLDAAAGRRRGDDGSTGEVVLDVANSLWGEQGLEWQQQFLDALARHYGAGMRLVDYRRDPDAAAALISAWTSEQTHGKIPELVPAGVLDFLTRLVLVNAVYFKAAWQEPFDKPSPRRPFTTEDGSRVEVTMMSHDLHRAAFCVGQGWRAARLAYIGGDVAMAIVVPDPGVSVGTVEASLDGPGLGGLLTSFRPVRAIRVEMPRWTFRLQSQLNTHLGALGMPTAFDPDEADFSGMTTQERLHISHVLHEAFIAVDEEGTEAAAASAVVAQTLSLPATPPLVLTADRPFLFVLFDVTTGTPLFIGRVSNPGR